MDGVLEAIKQGEEALKIAPNWKEPTSLSTVERIKNPWLV